MMVEEGAGADADAFGLMMFACAGAGVCGANDNYCIALHCTAQ